MKKQRGPYSPNQKSHSPCGCYYPDVVRLRDDKKRLVRILHCIHCGMQERRIKRDEVDETIYADLTPEERQAERARIRRGITRHGREVYTTPE
jgi:hypothetical protein